MKNRICLSAFCLAVLLFVSVSTVYLRAEVINVGILNPGGHRTIHAPSMAVYGNKLYIAFTGDNPGRNVNVISTSDGVNWSHVDLGPREQEHCARGLDWPDDMCSHAGPTLAVAEDTGTLFVAVPTVRTATGTYQIWSKYTTNGTAWSPTWNLITTNPAIDDRQQVALDFTNSGLVAFKSSDYDTEHRMFKDLLYPDGTIVPLSIGYFTDYDLDRTEYDPTYKANPAGWLKAWTGMDNLINITLYIPAWGKYGETQQVTGAWSEDGPSVAFDPPGSANIDHLAIGFIGTDPSNTINIYLSDGVNSSIKQLNQWSRERPAIEFWNGKIWVAWESGSSDQLLRLASLDPWSLCGDGVCASGETCSSCAQDCGSCPCGNGICESSESCSSCPQDCGTCCDMNCWNWCMYYCVANPPYDYDQCAGYCAGQCGCY